MRPQDTPEGAVRGLQPTSGVHELLQTQDGRIREEAARGDEEELEHGVEEGQEVQGLKKAE